MLRQNFTKIITSPKVYTRLLKLSYLAALASYFILPFLPLMGESGFISENAVNPTNPLPAFDVDRTLRIHQSLQNLPSNDSNAMLSYIESFFLKSNIDPHRINFEVKSEIKGEEKVFQGTNLYGIYSTKRGDPAECNLISFSHDLSSKNGEGKLEIALALSFLEMFVDTLKINYNSRDIIFLAYDGRYRANGRAIREFIESYYSGGENSIDRCGVIRQAINIEIERDDFNRIGLLHQGLNARVPDLDYYMIYTKLLNSIAANVWDVGVNPLFEKKMSNLIYKGYYLHAASLARSYLGTSLPSYDASTMIHSLKGFLVGNPHDIHTYLLEKGILAVTLKGYFCETCSTLRSQPAMITALGKVIEGANRACMALQEQLHAASTVWLATSKENVYFMFNGLLFVVLVALPLILKALINFYEQGNNRNVLRASLDHAALLITLWGLYELPRLFEFIWNYISNKNLSICSQFSSKQTGYDESFLSAFIAAGVLVLLFGTFVLPKLLQKLFPQTKFEGYTASQWKSKHGLFCGFAVMSVIGWGLSNIAFAFIGSFLILQIFLWTSPIRQMSIKGLLGNLMAFVWLALVIFVTFYLFQETGYSGFDVLKEILMRQACYGSDLYRFIIFFIVPSIVCFVQTLAF